MPENCAGSSMAMRLPALGGKVTVPRSVHGLAIHAELAKFVLANGVLLALVFGG
jgi:hypothetical protein